MTTIDLDAIRRRAAAAAAEIDALTAGERRWTMRVPADPERDSDLILDAALVDLLALADTVEQLTAALPITDGGTWETQYRHALRNGAVGDWSDDHRHRPLCWPGHCARRRIWLGPAEPITGPALTKET